MTLVRSTLNVSTILSILTVLLETIPALTRHYLTCFIINTVLTALFVFTTVIDLCYNWNDWWLLIVV